MSSTTPAFSSDLRQEMIQKAGGRATFPQVFIGATHVGGSDELHALESRGQHRLASGQRGNQDPMSAVKVAAIQMRTGMDPARNVVDFEALVRAAADAGAAYVQSPEMTGLLGARQGEAECRHRAGDGGCAGQPGPRN